MFDIDGGEDDPSPECSDQAEVIDAPLQVCVCWQERVLYEMTKIALKILNEANASWSVEIKNWYIENVYDLFHIKVPKMSYIRFGNWKS